MIEVIQVMLIAMVVAGVGIIIFSQNVVHAAYALALVLVSTAGFYVLLDAELMAVVQLLLYAGGVVILLVFGVMMTNRLKGNLLLSENRNLAIAAILSVCVFAGLCLLFSSMPQKSKVVSHAENQIESIGVSFLTDNLIAFELIAFVLLVALVGASYLAKMSRDE